MAATATEKRLLVGGDWIETGEWIEVRSPYDGEVVGRIPKAGADETRRAIDAAQEAMRTPLAAHKRAEILVKITAGIARRHEEAKYRSRRRNRRCYLLPNGCGSRSQRF